MRQTGCFSQIRTIFGGLAAFFVAMAFGQTPGTLDLSFAGVGYVTTTIGTSPSDDRARAVVVQPDGKIVVAGTCDDDFCMVRYLVNGSLDGTFGTGGRVVQNLVGTDTAYAMVMQPDGKFVLAGHCVAGLTSTFCAARFTTAGALDQSFGGASSGFVTINVTSAGDVAKAVTLQTDGKIVMAGACTNLSPSTGQDFCLVRLNGDGTPDLTFNGTGKVFTTFGGGFVNQGANAVALQPDGKILAAGFCDGGTYDRICVARYLPDGSSLDGTFGAGLGYVTTQAVNGVNTRAYQLAVLPSGKILVGAECGSDLCAVRYLPNGGLDATFANAGVLGSGASVAEAKVAALALDSDGSFVLGGWSNPISGITSRPARKYSAEGRFVSSMTTLLTGYFIAGEAQGWNGAVIHVDGKIIVAGPNAQQSDSTKGDFHVARFHGFPSDARNCSLDVDGDGKVLATTDSLIHARVALGMTGTAVTNGITFATHALRSNWNDIRTHLVTQCGMTLP